MPTTSMPTNADTLEAFDTWQQLEFQNLSSATAQAVC
jgi:hypothetical protein